MKGITMRTEEKVGVSYRQLHNWTQLGYILASGGHGRRFHYSPEELRLARILGHLVRLGFAPRKAARAVRAMADEGRTGSITLENGKLKVSGIFATLLRDANKAPAEEELADAA